MPDSLSPMNVKNNPMPTAKPIFRLSGIEFASQALILKTVSRVNRTPPMNIAPIAVCQL